MEFDRFVKVEFKFKEPSLVSALDWRENPFIEVAELITDQPRELVLDGQKSIKVLILRGPWQLNSSGLTECESLIKVVWEDKTGQAYCGNNSFCQLPSLREIVFPKVMRSLSPEFLSDCSNVKFVEYPRELVDYDFQAFKSVLFEYPSVMVNAVLTRTDYTSVAESLVFNRKKNRVYPLAPGCPIETTLLRQKFVTNPSTKNEHCKLISASCFLSSNSLQPYCSKGVSQAESEDFESAWLKNLRGGIVYDLD